MNAIIQRELIDVFRTRKSFAMQMLLAVLFAGMVILRWPSEAQVDLSGLNAQQVFRVFGYGMLAVLILLSPAFPATSVVREKNKGTLALLFNSPIPPWRIYLGKLIGVSGFLLLLLIMSLPAATACLMMGGISLWNEMVPLYGVLGLLTIQYAILGLWVSSQSTSADGALRTTYLLILGLAILSLLPYLLFQGKDSLVTDLSWWLRSFSPIPAVMEILGHGFVGSQGIDIEPGAPGRFFIASGVLTLGLAIHSLTRFNHKLFDKARDSGAVVNEMGVGTQIVRRLYFLVDPQRRSTGILPFVNPVLIKEFRCRKFGRSHWLLRFICLCAITSLILAYIATAGTLDWGTNVIGGIMILLQAGLIVLFTPSLAAGLICGEIESQGWQLLQMTPLSARKIVVGKLLSVIWTMMLVLCATLPGYLVMGWILPEKRPQIYQVLICLIWAALFSVLVSAAISSLYKKTAAATATAYAVLSSVCIGTFFCWLFRGAPFGEQFVEAVLCINPIAAAMQVIGTPGFVNYDLLSTNGWIMGIGCSLSLAILVVQTYRLTRPN